MVSMANVQKRMKMIEDVGVQGSHSVPYAVPTAVSKLKRRLKARKVSQAVPHVVSMAPKAKRQLRLPTSYYHVDTKGMCLLCYRERSNDLKPTPKKQHQEFSARFCKLILRYLKLEFQQNIARPSNLHLTQKRLKKIKIELCEDCSLLAANFCKMYTELETMRMRLDACVKQIADIMSLAGKIPARIKAYKERMGVMMRDDGVGQGSNSQNSKLETDVASKTMTVAQNFRKELIRKCSEKYKSAFPRLRLRDINMKPQTCSIVRNQVPGRPSTKAMVPKTLLQPSPSFEMLILGYSATFAAILYLANLYGPRSKEIGLIADRRGITGRSKDNDISISVGREDCGGNGVSAESAASSHQNKNGRIEAEERRNSMTITDSGKTIMLHQTLVKTEMFVDESEAFVEGEDYCEMETDAEGLLAGAEVGIAATAATATASSTNETPDPSVDCNSEDGRSSERSVMIDINDRTCRECNFQLSCRGELEKHRVMIHKLANYVECPRCKTMFPHYYALKCHRESPEGEACAIPEETEALEFETIAKPTFPWMCTVRGNLFCPLEGCFEVFAKEGALRLHLKTHGTFPCKFCTEKFEKAHDLAMHETQKHSDHSGFKCSRCDFHVGRQYNYLTHFLSHHLNIRVYLGRCELCQRGYNSAIEKQKHFISHHDTKGKGPEDIFKCTLCNAPFLKKNQLSRHLQHEHHVEQQTKFSCNLCYKPFLTFTLLQKHKYKEHDKLTDQEVKVKLKLQRKPPTAKRTKVKCQYCGLGFTTKSCLLLHVAKHKIELEQNKPTLEELEQDKPTLGELEQSIAPLHLEKPREAVLETPPKTPTTSVFEASPPDLFRVVPVMDTPREPIIDEGQPESQL